jgi:hypothetical protein
MPRTKIILGWEYDEPVKFMWIVETSWMQKVGTDIFRCDTAAKEDGCGAWLIESEEGNISHWYGLLPNWVPVKGKQNLPGGYGWNIGRCAGINPKEPEINPSNWTKSSYKKKQIIDLNNI